MSKTLFFCLLALSSVHGMAQKLSLSDALRSANENNGTVLAARLNYEAAKASTRAAYSAYLPTVTPSVRQENGRLDTRTGPGRGHTTIDSTDAGVSAQWLILDSGTREATVRRSRVNREQVELSTLDTYRGVLFDVHSSFYNALRAQQLLKVADAGYSRAKTLEDVAIKREAVGAGPKKDILQARADALNARVDVLTATNDVSTTLAALKAVLAWTSDTLPELDDSQDTRPTMADMTLEQAIAEGLANRPSLLSAKKRVESSRIDVRLARLDGSLTWQATANYDRSFSENVFDRSTLQLTASIPLFDGSRSRENIRAAEFGLKADEATLHQTERDVRADIEAAYKEFRQNFDRLDAAQLAREAAQENYRAASGAFNEGAGTVLDQLTAQVSLATAESNYVQAYYDLLISEVRLRLQMGRALPGEVKE